MKETFNVVLQIFKDLELDKWISVALSLSVITYLFRLFFGLFEPEEKKDYPPLLPSLPHYPRYHARTPRKVKRARWKNNQ